MQNRKEDEMLSSAEGKVSNIFKMLNSPILTVTVRN